MHTEPISPDLFNECLGYLQNNMTRLSPTMTSQAVIENQLVLLHPPHSCSNFQVFQQIWLTISVSKASFLVSRVLTTRWVKLSHSIYILGMV
jgi:hypothetical protein